MDNNNEMKLSEATEALCTAESAVESMDEMIKLFGVFDENPEGNKRRNWRAYNCRGRLHTH